MTDVKWCRAVLAGLAANLASFVVGGGGYVLFDWTGTIIAVVYGNPLREGT